LRNLPDVPVFVAVLLGTDADPGQRQRADLNCGGTADGRDVQLLLDRLTAQ
jgi:hypothetical protein